MPVARQTHSRRLVNLKGTAMRSAAPCASQHERVPLINLKGCSGSYPTVTKPDWTSQRLRGGSRDAQHAGAVVRP